MSRETRRLNLQSRLEEILGSNNVYFQPPASIHMRYPCFVYNYDNATVLHASNVPYKDYDRYTLTLITKDPLPETVMSEIDSIPYARFSRHFVEDNLHHFSYTVSLTERTNND